MELRSIVSDDLPMVLVDSEKIGHVFSNLISNAIKWTPPGGSITVNSWEDDAIQRLTRDPSRGYGELRLTHRRTPVGIQRVEIDPIHRQDRCLARCTFGEQSKHASHLIPAIHVKQILDETVALGVSEART